MLTKASLTSAVRQLAPDLPAAQCDAEPRRRDPRPRSRGPPTRRAKRRAGCGDDLCARRLGDRDEPGFRDALERAARPRKTPCADHDGVVPTRPDRGRLHQPGDMVHGGSFLRRVARFVEKPDRARAEAMRREGTLEPASSRGARATFWRSCARTHRVAPALDMAAGDATRFFAEVQPIAVDVGVLERSSRVMMLLATSPGTTSDLGLARPGARRDAQDTLSADRS